MIPPHELAEAVAVFGRGNAADLPELLVGVRGLENNLMEITV